MRIYSGKVFRLQEHLVRLWESADSIALKIPISLEKLTADVNEAVAKNGLNDGYIRLVVTRGSGPLGLDPTSAAIRKSSSSPTASRCIPNRFTAKAWNW